MGTLKYTEDGVTWKALLTGPKGDPGPAGPVGPTGTSGFRRNRVMNSAFKVNQRGHVETPITNTSAYPHDRWLGASGSMSGSGVAYITSGLAAIGAGLPEGERGYAMLSAYNTAGTSTSHHVYLLHRIEDVGTLAGKTVTLSFYASILQATAMNLGIGINQYFGVSGSASVATYPGTFSILPSGWRRYSITFIMPSVAGKTVGANNFVELQFFNSAGNAFWPAVGSQHVNTNISCVQLEEGSVATAYEHRSLGEELEACKRYYQRYTNLIPWRVVASEWSQPILDFLLPVEMQKVPVATILGSFETQAYPGAVANLAGITLISTSTNTNTKMLRVTLSGPLAPGTVANLYSGGGGGILEVSADL